MFLQVLQDSRESPFPFAFEGCAGDHTPMHACTYRFSSLGGLLGEGESDECSCLLTSRYGSLGN